ncbi:TetR/AcrR family transcriptional regulator [Paenibacillus sp. OV219]|uniref:TetR/AcrR family transcriptional regulator n=1 Tax=Paenibacillus sp. OV219 TaxID=1884377 RepID=UPI0008D698AA|nr:TetR/AcrR family transcriptional regulator [Paenibacillus sp. OV219]SEO00457.1 transcriptional regulator, TetR family [Paenibacillus sp. OV219]
MLESYYTDSFKKISQEKQDKILNAAIIEFAEHGFDSANINQIAQKAEISVGSLYKYFGSKEELYLMIIRIGIESTKKVLEEIMLGEQDFLSRIERIIRTIQLQSRENLHLTRLYNIMAAESKSELAGRIVSEMENDTAGLYASFIAEAQASHSIRADIHPQLFAFFLDNLFITLQFSYSSDYYKERLRTFAGIDIHDQDELVAEQLIKFIKGAFFLN